MKLKEAKEQIAIKYGYSSWQGLRFSHSMSFGLWENYLDKAAELYAQTKNSNQWLSIKEHTPKPFRYYDVWIKDNDMAFMACYRAFPSDTGSMWDSPFYEVEANKDSIEFYRERPQLIN